MRELMRFEYRKLFRARVLYVCTGIMILLVLLFAGTEKLIESVAEQMQETYIVSDYSDGELPPDMAGLVNGTEDAAGLVPGADNASAVTIPGAEDASAVTIPGAAEEQGGMAVTEEQMDVAARESLGMSLDADTGVGRMLAALSNVYVVVILGVFTAVFICGDFGNAVVKNIITKGYTRKEIFFAKHFITLIACEGMALVSMIAGFLCGVLMWGNVGEWSLKVLGLILLQLLLVAAFHALFSFLAFALKRVGTAMAIAIAIPVGMSLVLTLVDLLINNPDFQLSRFWLDSGLTDAAKLSSSGSDLLISALCGAAYLAVFTLLGYLSARKREV